MKVNMVTGKPGDGGPARCLLISEQADQALDFFTELRANKGVLADTGEKFVNIALFQRPQTTKRSTFQESIEEETAKPDESAKPPGNGRAAKKPKAEEKSPEAGEGTEQTESEETGV